MECMEYMNTEVLILQEKNMAEIIRVVCASLLNGEICIIPTDTIYGIVALDSYSESVKKIYEIKERSITKPFIRLIGKLECMSLYTRQDIPEALKTYWPGLLTIIFKAIEGGTVALRFPDDNFLRGLFHCLDYRALVAPSANMTGKENIFQCKDLVDNFKGLVNIIVCLKQRPRDKRASTIIDISGPDWKIIREGPVHIEL